jgi:hypothetical protein
MTSNEVEDQKMTDKIEEIKETEEEKKIREENEAFNLLVAGIKTFLKKI